MKFLNNYLQTKSSLSVIIQAYGITHKKIILLSKKKLSIVLCIQKFQSDIFNKKFILCVDCKSAKEILQKDVQNLVSKQIFVR